MEIVWLGHSSFRLKGKDVTVVTDPFAASVGYAFPKVEADIVTVSHAHDDHNNYKAVGGEVALIDGPGEYEIKGVSIFGIDTFHDNEQGAQRGKNTIFLIDIDGVKLCHLGDLGHGLSKEIVEEIGEVHVLLVPVGGWYTIDAKVACEVTRAIDPKIIVPMHYNTSDLNQESFGRLSEVDEFVKSLGMEKDVQPKINLNVDRLPELARLVVLERK